MSVITLKLRASDGIGTLSFNGKTYNCGGKVGFPYPKDSTLDGYKEVVHHSKQYNCDMKYSVLWIGQKGVYIHEWPCLKYSSGCIHLLAPDAKEFFDSISGKTRLLFQWV